MYNKCTFSPSKAVWFPQATMPLSLGHYHHTQPSQISPDDPSHVTMTAGHVHVILQERGDQESKRSC